MIKAILTDLDGVVRRWNPEILSQAEAATGLPRGAILSTAFEPDLLHRATTGQITDAYWRRVIVERLQDQHPNADAEEAVQLWSMSPGEIDAGVLGLLQRCRKKPRLVLITNATARLNSDLQRLGIDQSFDLIVNSSTIGHVKPQPDIFEAALNLLHISANEALFIDDNPGHVASAVAIGIAGHHFTTYDRLKEDMKRYGLPY